MSHEHSTVIITAPDAYLTTAVAIVSRALGYADAYRNVIIEPYKWPHEPAIYGTIGGLVRSILVATQNLATAHPATIFVSVTQEQISRRESKRSLLLEPFGLISVCEARGPMHAFSTPGWYPPDLADEFTKAANVVMRNLRNGLDDPELPLVELSRAVCMALITVLCMEENGGRATLQ